MTEFFRIPGEGIPIDASEGQDPFEPPIANYFDPRPPEPLTDAELIGFRAAAGIANYVGQKSRVVIQNPGPESGSVISVEGQEIPVGIGKPYITYRRSKPSPQ